MEIIKMFRKSKISLQIAVTTLITIFSVTAFVGATTIGTNVSTGGTLTVTGASTLTGLATMLGGATTTSLTLLNGETISNATDGTVAISGIASSTSITLLNGEGITNAVDGTLNFGSANLTTTGTLSVTGLATLLGGATTTSLTLLNGEAISNATDGTISFGAANLTTTGTLSVTGLATLLGGATTTSITLLNGETIDNATDGTIAITGNGTISGTLGVTGATTLTGALSANGNTTLGNAASDTLTINVATTTLADTGTISSGSQDGTTLRSLYIAPLGSAATTGISYHELMRVASTFGDPLHRTYGLSSEFTRSGATTAGFDGTDTGLVSKVTNTVTHTEAYSMQGAYIKAKNTGTVTGIKALDLEVQAGTNTSAYGLTLHGTGTFTDISLQNGETISNSTNGNITLGGILEITDVPFASLPATCTPGSVVKTSGSDNCTGAGGTDGALCVCAANGTAWALLVNY